MSLLARLVEHCSREGFRCGVLKSTVRFVELSLEVPGCAGLRGFYYFGCRCGLVVEVVGPCLCQIGYSLLVLSYVIAFAIETFGWRFLDSSMLSLKMFRQVR